MTAAKSSLHGEAMLRMADQHQPFVADALDGQSRQTAGISHQPKVNLVVEHQFVDFANVSVTVVDSDVRERLPELPEDGLELMEAKAETGGQTEHADGVYPQAPDVPFGFTLEPENFQKTFVAEPAFGRDLEMLPVAHSTADAKMLFREPEGVAGTERREAVFSRGFGETSGGNNIAEHPEGAHLHDAMV